MVHTVPIRAFMLLQTARVFKGLTRRINIQHYVSTPKISHFEQIETYYANQKGN